jgi:hypothetical protein
MLSGRIDPPDEQGPAPREWPEEPTPRRTTLDMMLSLEDRAIKRGNWLAFVSAYDGVDFSDEEVTR